MTDSLVEVTTMHTRILRCTLAVDDSQAYWRNVDLAVPIERRVQMAFEQRWFGMKSEARVDTLIRNMTERFDAFPQALALLRAHSAPLERLFRPDSSSRSDRLEHCRSAATSVRGDGRGQAIAGFSD